MNGLQATHIDVGCYVADALDSDERAAFEAHLVDCESCSSEVVEFSETSAELAWLVAMVPPRNIRGSVLSAIRTVRPLPPATEPHDQDLKTLRAGSGTPDLATDQLAARRAGRKTRGGWRRTLTALIAAAAVIALALGGFVYNLNEQRQTDLVAQAAEARQNDLLSAPDAKIYTTTRGGAQYSFVVSKQRNAALFLGSDLPNPGAGKTYQLWTLQGRRAFPDALVDPSLGTQWFSGTITAATSLAISVEAAGGARQPTPPILAQVTI